APNRARCARRHKHFSGARVSALHFARGHAAIQASAVPRQRRESRGGIHMKTGSIVKAGLCAVVVAAVALSTNPSRAQNAPHYEADLSWPKPLPDHWILGGLGGLCVDAQDHVLILNRQDVLPNELDAGYLAPPLIEFDAAGDVVHSWGDPKLLDARLHSCH